MIIASLHSIKITIRQNFNTSAGASLVDPTAITFEINVHSTCKQSLWSYLISKGCLNEAEKNFICFSGLFGFGLVHDAHHLINPLRQQCEALHLVDVMSVLVSLSPPASHNNTICLKRLSHSECKNEWMQANTVSFWSDWLWSLLLLQLRFGSLASVSHLCPIQFADQRQDLSGGLISAGTVDQRSVRLQHQVRVLRRKHKHSRSAQWLCITS